MHWQNSALWLSYAIPYWQSWAITGTSGCPKNTTHFTTLRKIARHKAHYSYFPQLRADCINTFRSRETSPVREQTSLSANTLTSAFPHKTARLLNLDLPQSNAKYQPERAWMRILPPTQVGHTRWTVADAAGRLLGCSGTNCRSGTMAIDS